MSIDLNKILDALEDLKSEEVRKRTLAVSQLGTIASIFGQERTKQMLVPFLKEFEEDEEDVLIELSKQFVPIAKVLSDKDSAIPELIIQFSIVLNYEDFSVINEVF